MAVAAGCGGSNTTKSAGPTSSTSPPPSISAPGDLPIQDVIFSDDFSNHGGGWPEAADGSTAYGPDGTYRIVVPPRGAGVVRGVPTAPALADVGNIDVEVAVAVRAGTGSAGSGCRAGEGLAGYDFLIDTAGTSWVIDKRSAGGTATELKRGAGGGALKPAPAVNRMRIECSTASDAGPGNPARLALSVNGVALGEVVDTSEPFVVGRPGVVAVRAGGASVAGAPLEVAFDDFVVHQRPG